MSPLQEGTLSYANPGPLEKLESWPQTEERHAHKQMPEQSGSYSLGPDLKQRASRESWEGVSEQDRLFRLCLW